MIAYEQGSLCRKRGDIEGAIQWREVALQEFTSIPSPRYQQHYLAMTYQALGNAHLELQHYNEARSHLRKGLILWRQMDNKYQQAQVWFSLAYVEKGLGRPRRASRFLRKAISLCAALSETPASRRLMQQIEEAFDWLYSDIEIVKSTTTKSDIQLTPTLLSSLTTENDTLSNTETTFNEEFHELGSLSKKKLVLSPQFHSGNTQADPIQSLLKIRSQYKLWAIVGTGTAIVSSLTMIFIGQKLMNIAFPALSSEVTISRPVLSLFVIIFSILTIFSVVSLYRWRLENTRQHVLKLMHEEEKYAHRIEEEISNLVLNRREQ